MFADDDLLPISALQHLLFCERQAMLIHLERLWAENRLTVEGNHLHRKAHSATSGWKDGVYVGRGLDLVSYEFGLTGKSDIVEFAPPASTVETPIASLPLLSSDALAGWNVRPVEYKRGRPKKNDCDRIQLAAQAICLEEMLGIRVPMGLLFYGERRRRTEVVIDAPLRTAVRNAAGRLHELFASRRTPPARRELKCDACSLLHLCLPSALQHGPQASRFAAEELLRNVRSAGPRSDSHQEDLE